MILVRIRLPVAEQEVEPTTWSAAYFEDALSLVVVDLDGRRAEGEIVQLLGEPIRAELAVTRGRALDLRRVRIVWERVQPMAAG